MGRLSPRRIAIAAAAALAVTPAAVLAVSQGASLVRNGTFTQGTGSVPEGWRTEAWGADLSQFSWSTDGGEGTISIASPKANDARWCQTIQVEPGASYRVAARVKTSEVGASTAGAFVAIEPRIADTSDVRGTSDWRTVEIVATAGEQPNWDICPRLGSYASLNTGTAWFRDVSVTLIGAAPAQPGWLSRSVASLRPTVIPSWLSIVVPLAGGVLLGYGLGILRRRQ